MFFNLQNARWWVWVNMFFVGVLMSLVLNLSLGEARGFSADSADQYVIYELPVLYTHRVVLMSERASSAMVKTIMTLLATFDEAGVLPPEGTDQANQVIHGFIQLQSALMKSASPEFAAYRIAAEAHWISQHHERQGGVLGEEGLTTEALAALILYDQEHPMWEDHKIISAMQAFNVTHEDWVFMVDLFHKANAVYREQDRSIHKVFEAWRMNLSGGKL